MKYQKASMLALLLTTLTLSTQSQAIKIIPHFTAGPFGIFSTYLSGPRPVLPGSDRGANTPSTADDTGTDCNAIVLGSRFSTQTGNVCQAIAEWEALIKDDITVDIEFYTVPHFSWDYTFLSVQQYAILTSPNLDGAGYEAVRHVMKIDENRERDSLHAPRHLPKYKDISVYLASFLPQDWKPQAIWGTTAAYKALGLDLNTENFLNIELNGGVFTTLSRLDATIIHGNFPGYVWDFDPRNGVGIGPLTLSQWEDGWFNIPGYFNNLQLPYLAYQLHEIGHALGYDSTEPLISGGFMLSLPEDIQGISLLDLFRFAETDIKGANSDVKNFGKYQTMPRQLAIRENTTNTNNVFPVELELGNHVLVYDLHPTKGLKYIPMAGGALGPGYGDSTHGSHSRNGFYIDFINSNVNWIEDRCPVNATNCDPIVGDPNHTPTGRLMDPIALEYLHQDITLADAIGLDLIGYDIDYSKLPNLLLTTGVFSEANTPKVENVTMEDLKAQFGVDVKGTTGIIKEQFVKRHE